MKYYAPLLEQLIEHFERFPGIGRKTAQRMAFFVLNQPEEKVKSFADCLVNAKSEIHRCSECCNLTDGEKCSVCSDPSRDRSTICVVEEPKDVVALEAFGKYRGLYHVLHGSISPLEGVGPDDLTVKELLARVSQNAETEVIMATNPDVEGDATALYLSRLLRPLGARVTRIAYGIPVGGELEFADGETINAAIEGRREME